tara:strand:- start:1938 stop:2810 length:873 start_codon:yes stop_codon:yes gene_type:complete
MKSLLKTLVVGSVALGTTAIVQGYVSVPSIQNHLPAKLSFSQEEAPWETFFSVFGVIYAILVGFLVVKVLERFTSLSDALEGEVNALQDVRDLLTYFEGKQDAAKRELLTQLDEYVRSVAYVEWKAMSRRKRMDRIDSETTQELMDMMRAANLLKVDDHSDEVALGCIINRLTDVTSYRTSRISLAQERLPKRLKGLLWFMSMVLVLGFMVMEVAHPAMHLGMVAAISVAGHLVVGVIFDLDHPLTGTWNVSQAPLLDAIEAFERELMTYRMMDGARSRETGMVEIPTAA